MGRYSVIVGISNPATVTRLVHLGCILANEYGGRVTAVTVVEMTDRRPAPNAEPHDRMTAGYDLLNAGEAVAREYAVPYEGRIAVGRPVAEVLDEVARAQQARLIVVGYSEADSSRSHNADFERLIDEIADQASCDLLVARFRGPERFERVLAPVSERLNMDIRREFLLALHHQLGTRIEIVHFAGSEQEGAAMHEELTAWMAERQAHDFVELRVEVHADPGAAIVAASADYDAVVLGAAPLFEVRRRYFGPVAEYVAQHAACSTFLLRPHVIRPDD